MTERAGGVDRSIIGQEFDKSVSEPVTREQIHEFAAAIGETDPLHTGDDPVAPPTFCVRFRGDLFFHPGIPRELLMTGFDAGKDIAFGVPIRPGDVVHGSSVVHDMYEKTGRSGTMLFIVFRQTQTNGRGETVAVIDSRFVFRSKDRS
jgi:acyl dehydratase